MTKFNKIIIFVLVIFLISSCSNKRQELNPDSITYCENIKNEESQERCFINYAKKIVTIDKDEALAACKYINTSLLKDICIFDIVKRGAKDGSFCGEIEDSSLRFKCLRSRYKPHLTELTD